MYTMYQPWGSAWPQMSLSKSSGILPKILIVYSHTADDLLVYGSTIEEHDNNLKALLDRCRDVNLTLNPKKLRFKSDNVPFF